MLRKAILIDRHGKECPKERINFGHINSHKFWIVVGGKLFWSITEHLGFDFIEDFGQSVLAELTYIWSRKEEFYINWEGRI